MDFTKDELKSMWRQAFENVEARAQQPAPAENPDCLARTLLWDLAYDPRRETHLTADQQQHLAGCERCRRSRARAGKKLWHPTPGELWKYLANTLEDTVLRAAIGRHLDETTCLQCEQLATRLQAALDSEAAESEPAAPFRDWLLEWMDRGARGIQGALEWIERAARQPGLALQHAGEEVPFEEQHWTETLQGATFHCHIREDYVRRPILMLNISAEDLEMAGRLIWIHLHPQPKLDLEERTFCVLLQPEKGPGAERVSAEIALGPPNQDLKRPVVELESEADLFHVLGEEEKCRVFEQSLENLAEYAPAAIPFWIKQVARHLDNGEREEDLPQHLARLHRWMQSLT